MKHCRFEIPISHAAKSLCWKQDDLVDWVGGNRVVRMDGTEIRASINWAYPFDAAVQSPSGQVACIYQRRGTKGLIIEGKRFVREINRSYYHANAYEFPIVLFQHPDGRELMAHCPDRYNKIEIEETLTGKCLTAQTARKPSDFFHSRLAISPDQTRLLSAGWAWHPFDSIKTWNIADALANAAVLDECRQPAASCEAEINSAAFVDSQRLVLSSNVNDVNAEMLGEESGTFTEGSIGIFNLAANAFETLTKVQETLGTMMWLGDGKIVSLFNHPKIVDVSTGQVIFRWADIKSGNQSSSIIHHIGLQPHIALDAINKRFAVAVDNKITVIQIE